jgi:hypothetical protein
MDLIDRQALLRKLFPYEVVDKKNCAINSYAVEKAIMDMPKMNKEIKDFCKDCIHNEVCLPHLQAKDGVILNLSYCEFYKKGDDNG